MPNHIQNRLRFLGEAADVQSALAHIAGKYDDGTPRRIDFNKIIEMPEELLEEVAGLNPPWYVWALKNWGTKWNAYQQGDSRDTVDTVHFQTAWSAPIDLMNRLSTQLPALTLELAYADEDSGYNAGRYTFQNGIVLDSYSPQGGSVEAYELYFELHPDDRANWVLIDGRYRHVEDED